MFQIDLKSRKAIYEQIMDNFKALITTGVLKPDERAPSVRELARALTVNPNTIQKAYRELEAQGYFYTVLGQGSFVAAPPKEGSAVRIRALLTTVGDSVRELEFLGVSRTQTAEFILTGIRPIGG